MSRYRELARCASHQLLTAQHLVPFRRLPIGILQRTITHFQNQDLVLTISTHHPYLLSISTHHQWPSSISTKHQHPP
jgi:hypothetical protein